ncbi:hypothetical protein RSAG8_05736, partial [Rhizoctonia solani AG-8 WAC10335]
MMRMRQFKAFGDYNPFTPLTDQGRKQGEQMQKDGSTPEKFEHDLECILTTEITQVGFATNSHPTHPHPSKRPRSFINGSNLCSQVSLVTSPLPNCTLKRDSLSCRGET